MCMEDIRIGRRKRTKVITIPPTGALVELSNASTVVTNVAIVKGGVDSLIVVFTGADGVPQSFVHDANISMLSFDVETYGDLLHRNISLTSSGPNTCLAFVTTLSEE